MSGMNFNISTGLIPLLCPSCKQLLNNHATGLICRHCNKIFPVIDGIPSFLDTNPFYEGKFADTEPAPARFKWRIANLAFVIYCAFSQSHIRNRFIGRMMGTAGEKRLILDMGCGGGAHYLANMGDVVGVDISLASLRNANKLYKQVVHADISSTPFPDACFDFIVSRDVLGHIPLVEKNKVYQEMFRVCRDGGYIIHAIEVESRNPVWQIAKKTPSLFNKYFVDKYGHYGLEIPIEACRRLQKAAFRPVKIRPLFKTGIVRANQYIAMFDNEYRQRSRVLNCMVAMAKIVDRNAPLRGIYNFLAGVLDTFVGAVLPLSWAQLLLVCYKKTQIPVIDDNR